MRYHTRHSMLMTGRNRRGQASLTWFAYKVVWAKKHLTACWSRMVYGWKTLPSVSVNSKFSATEVKADGGQRKATYCLCARMREDSSCHSYMWGTGQSSPCSPTQRQDLQMAESSSSVESQIEASQTSIHFTFTLVTQRKVWALQIQQLETPEWV